MIPSVRNNWRLGGVLLGVLIGVLALTAAAPAPVGGGQVSVLTFQQRIDANSSVTVEVSFDGPVAAGQAADVRRTLGARPVQGGPQPPRLKCRQNLEDSDRNGEWSLQYTCLPTYAILNWHQDYLTWRHNIGPGGRIAVTFAGSVALG